MTIRAYAAAKIGGRLEPFEYEPGALRRDEVEIVVDYCGLCHSDISMLDNAWGISEYPLVAGHEVVGKVSALGEDVRHLSVGQTVGIGWCARSCLACEHCRRGDHNLCASVEGIFGGGRHGGFADRVRVQAAWVNPLPPGLDVAKAGPLLCAGITVFNPLVQFDVRPTDRAGVVGIGGLGHVALKFLRAWGCEVTAFTTNPAKAGDALAMGAHHVAGSRDSEALKRLAGSLDFILVTVNVPLDWNAYLAALRPRGRLHFVGAVLEPVPAPVFPLIVGQKSISGTPTGGPAAIAAMLDFAARHGIEPVTETCPLSKVNEAIEDLRAGKPRYRLVLDCRG
ncbi:MAG: NAD(P)-dependent alcohol dehydrogenase [Thermoguttaceae bacterium]|jgi:uncharacterized zinc-type alcohol dehydrogenase-like protein